MPHSRFSQAWQCIFAFSGLFSVFLLELWFLGTGQAEASLAAAAVTSPSAQNVSKQLLLHLGNTPHTFPTASHVDGIQRELWLLLRSNFGAAAPVHTGSFFFTFLRMQLHLRFETKPLTFSKPVSQDDRKRLTAS